MGKILDFLLHQETHGRLLHELRDAGRAGMRAMGRAERVVHINIAELRQRLRKRRIVRFFAGVKPDVLQQRDVPLVHVANDRFRNVANRFRAERDRVIDQRVQIIAHRPQRIFLDRFPFRPAEVRHQDRLRAVFAEIIYRRKAFPDPGVVRDRDFPVALLGGNIEIDADEDALTEDVEIANR